MISKLYTYYNEIKNRIMLMVIAWIFSLTICYSYKEAILFITINSNSMIIPFKTKPYFIFTSLTEVFYVHLELSLFIANQITIFYLCYQLLMFLTLGLYHSEFQKLKLAIQIFFVFWLISNILLHEILIPLSWIFFLGFQNSLNLTQPIPFFFEAKLIEYYYYFTNVYYMSLISCQFLAILILVLFNLNENLKKTLRKLFYIVFLIFSTLITPPDVISQILITISLIIMYESLIVLSQIRISMATN